MLVHTTLMPMYTTLMLLHTTLMPVHTTLMLLHTTLMPMYTTLMLLHTTLMPMYTTLMLVHTTLMPMYTTLMLLHTTLMPVHTTIMLLHTTLMPVYTTLMLLHTTLMPMHTTIMPGAQGQRLLPCCLHEPLVSALLPAAAVFSSPRPSMHHSLLTVQVCSCWPPRGAGCSRWPPAGGSSRWDLLLIKGSMLQPGTTRHNPVLLQQTACAACALSPLLMSTASQAFPPLVLLAAAAALRLAPAVPRDLTRGLQLQFELL